MINRRCIADASGCYVTPSRVASPAYPSDLSSVRKGDDSVANFPTSAIISALPVLRSRQNHWPMAISAQVTYSLVLSTFGKCK